MATSVTNIRAYSPTPAPTMPAPDGDRVYIQRELQKIKTAVSSIIDAMRLIDARVTVLEP